MCKAAMPEDCRPEIAQVAKPLDHEDVPSPSRPLEGSMHCTDRTEIEAASLPST